MSLSMIPRGRLYVGWSDFLLAVAACMTPGSREAMERRIEEIWSSDSLVTLSVRSGLDLFLTAMEYPKGSEILVSAVTIRDMIKIIEFHGLVPVPVDLDMNTLTVKMESLRCAVTPKTKAILVAHLFGGVMPLDEIAEFAKERGLPLIEDMAQSFTGLEYRGHPASDVTLFSFGPIKTATALGGAILGVRDKSLRDRMRARQSTYATQGRMSFLRRIWRFLVVRLVMYPFPFGMLVAWCRFRNQNHDELINLSVRGFAGHDLIKNIRHQPSYPLLALLRHRLQHIEGARIAKRIAVAQTMIRLLPNVRRPGRDAAIHSYWTFPILSAGPDELVRHLWSRGFDATRGSWSLYCVPCPASGNHARPAEAQQAMSQIVYLPHYPEISAARANRAAAAVLEFVSRGTPDAAPSTP